MPLSQKQIQTLANYLAPNVKQYVTRDVVDFAHSEYYIPESGAPIKLLPHQCSILNYAFKSGKYQTIVYSTVKKSGKTAIAGLVARWVAENWGPHVEVYCIANDLEQARGRVYAAATQSIELNPLYNRYRRELTGKWKIIEREARYLPTNSILRAVSSDYKGEAGSNPTCTLWSELWGYTSEASRRLWDELTPVPTRPRSVRYVETYAGYTSESDLLLDLYHLGLEGRRLTHDDIYWPFEDQPPIWVNENTSVFMYWDSGITARRMPWQTPEYYAIQERTLRPQAFTRLHLNEWTDDIDQFIPIEWWDSCQVPLPHLDNRTPVILGVDGAVRRDCCGVVGVTRWNKNEIAHRFSYIWYPPSGGTINLGEVEKTIRELCKRYNIVQIAYDEYQLHKMMSDISSDGVAWCRPFSQATARSLADKQLYDLIRDKRIVHAGDVNVREHLDNAAAKQSLDEDTKLRIVKKRTNAKIDLVVALSMASYECLRLNL